MTIVQHEDLEDVYARMCADFEEMIPKFGAAIMSVFADKESGTPPFAYTIGQFELGMPEFIVVGADGPGAGSVLGRLLATYVMQGLKPQKGDRVRGLLNGGFDLRLGSVDQKWFHDHYLVQSQQRHERAGHTEPLTALQLLVPDPDGRFPLDEGFDTVMVMLQPSLAVDGEWDYLGEERVVQAENITQQEFMDFLEQMRRPN